jgi:RNA polymerase sigma-70 factor (ECF subfamily)
MALRISYHGIALEERSGERPVDFLTDEADEILIRLCREGEERAFEALYRRYRRAIANFAYQMLRDRELAADVLQETFCYFFRKLPDYEPRAKLSTLLFKVARNLCLNRLKKQRRGRALSIDESRIDPPGDETDPLSRLENEELVARIHEALGELPEIYREAISLKILQGLTYDEIGAIADCPPGTVKSRLHNGLELLRRAVRKKI